MINVRKDLLSKAKFGSRIAEDEVDDLESYFVETEQWRKILSGEVDIVFGSKGSGKSALYSLLLSKRDKLRLGQRTIFLAAENPRGTPAFRDLTTAPPLSEEQFRGLWKLYFLSISASYLRHHMESTKSSSVLASEVIDVLSENGLLAQNANLITRLKLAFEYLKRNFSIETTVAEPNTGFTVTGKITLSEPTAEQRNRGYYSLDQLAEKLNSAFSQFAITNWLVLDRLDVAFADSPELEGNALRSLFRVYLDFLSLSHIKIKIFLRDDIWKKIIGEGFREASHVTRTLTLSWDQQTLLNLLIRRIANNELICKYYNVQRDNLLNDVTLQNTLFYKIFPKQVDIGKRMPKTLDWMLSRTADGSRRTAPRELIHLLLESRDEQLKLYQLGNSQLVSDELFSKASLRAALPAVSKIRYEQTLCAENSSLRPYLNKLERERTQQSLESLSKLWVVDFDRTAEIAERLVESGFFERRGTKSNPIYWVPFLYRDALDLVQGSA